MTQVLAGEVVDPDNDDEDQEKAMTHSRDFGPLAGEMRGALERYSKEELVDLMGPVDTSITFKKGDEGSSASTYRLLNVWCGCCCWCSRCCVCCCC